MFPVTDGPITKCLLYYTVCYPYDNLKNQFMCYLSWKPDKTNSKYLPLTNTALLNKIVHWIIQLQPIGYVLKPNFFKLLFLHQLLSIGLIEQPYPLLVDALRGRSLMMSHQIQPIINSRIWRVFGRNFFFCHVVRSFFFLAFTGIQSPDPWRR